MPEERIDPDRLDRALMQSLAAGAPEGVEFLWNDEVERRIDRPSPWTHELRQGFYVGRTGEVGWAGLTVHHISPWVDGITLRLGDDVTQFEGGMEFLLDQASDEVSEAARSAWPNSSFPKPHAHVDDGQLRTWFGPEDHPDLALAPIDLRTVLVADE